MGKKKGLSQTPLWVLSEEEMEAAGWPDFDPPQERYSVLEDGPDSLTSVWDPMRDDASKQIEGHAQKSRSGQAGKRRILTGRLFRLLKKRRPPRA